MGCSVCRRKQNKVDIGDALEMDESPTKNISSMASLSKFSANYRVGSRLTSSGFSELRRCVHRLSGRIRAVHIYKRSLISRRQ